MQQQRLARYIFICSPEAGSLSVKRWSSMEQGGAGPGIGLKEWRHSSAGEIVQKLDHIGRGALLGFENGDIPWVKSDKDLWLVVHTRHSRRMHLQAPD